VAVHVITADAMALPLGDAMVHAICTDPPYGLEFMGKAWDRLGDSGRLTHPGPAERDASTPWGRHRVTYNGSENTKCRACGKWTYSPEASRCHCPVPDIDRARQARVMQAWHQQWATEAYRVLKPGGWLLAFGSPRTAHRLAAGIEDAGFELRDTIAWLYGQGFPKNRNAARAVDEHLGVAPTVVGEWSMPGRGSRSEQQRYGLVNDAGQITAPTSDQAKAWDGWGTALKPGYEPIVVARKPMAGNLATNLLAHGAGALHIDGGRIAGVGAEAGRVRHGGGSSGVYAQDDWTKANQATMGGPMAPGRWPPNVLLTHSAACRPASRRRPDGPWQCALDCPVALLGDGPSQFYPVTAWDAELDAELDGLGFRFQAKAGKAERIAGPGANTHPTVKPVAVIRWLLGLVAVPGALIVDPFAGSGTTGIAATLDGWELLAADNNAQPGACTTAAARIAYAAELHAAGRSWPPVIASGAYDPDALRLF
jgi:site-specific DNA-methyltransferase (adenine-specific)